MTQSSAKRRTGEDRKFVKSLMYVYNIADFVKGKSSLSAAENEKPYTPQFTCMPILQHARWREREPAVYIKAGSVA